MPSKSLVTTVQSFDPTQYEILRTLFNKSSVMAGGQTLRTLNCDIKATGSKLTNHDAEQYN